MGRAELEALKLRKFRNLVNHAYNHSPHYQKIINRLGINKENCVPADFPILTKPELIEHFDEIVTDRRLNREAVSEFLTNSPNPDDLLFGEYRVTHTSGSSGQIGFFVFSQSDWGRGIPQLRRQQRVSSPRALFRRLRIAYYGATRGHFGGVSMISTCRQGLLSLRYRLSLNDVNEPLSDVITRLNNFQPDLLSGYTTALKILAEKQLGGDLKINPITVISSGEAQSTADRKLFARAFGCEVVNGYGSTEQLMMGVSQPDGNSMVLYDDDLIYEFNEDHTIVTNLFNYTLPLIRYYMTDELRPAKDGEAVGPYLLVDNLVGRSEIVPTFVNRDGVEDFISPFIIIEFYIRGVSRFQMRLVDKTHFVFAICLDTTVAGISHESVIQATESRLRQMLNQKHMENVTFDVLIVDDLPVNEKTGKFQLIVDFRKDKSHPTHWHG